MDLTASLVLVCVADEMISSPNNKGAWLKYVKVCSETLS